MISPTLGERPASGGLCVTGERRVQTRKSFSLEGAFISCAIVRTNEGLVLLGFCFESAGEGGVKMTNFSQTAGIKLDQQIIFLILPGSFSLITFCKDERQTEDISKCLGAHTLPSSFSTGVYMVFILSEISSSDVRVDCWPAAVYVLLGATDVGDNGSLPQYCIINQFIYTGGVFEKVSHAHQG